MSTNTYDRRRVREGKTAKDKKSGAWASRFANRAARNEWCNNPKARGDQHPSGNK